MGWSRSDCEKRPEETARSIDTRLAKVLCSYHVTPQSTTGVSPAELLLGRRPRTLLDLLKPHTAERVEAKQLQQKKTHDVQAKTRVFCVQDNVYVKNYGTGGKWFSGQTISQTEPVSFHVPLDNGYQRRCHQDHLRLRVAESDVQQSSESSLTGDDPSFLYSASETLQWIKHLEIKLQDIKLLIKVQETIQQHHQQALQQVNFLKLNICCHQDVFIHVSYTEFLLKLCHFIKRGGMW